MFNALHWLTLLTLLYTPLLQAEEIPLVKLQATFGAIDKNYDKEYPYYFKFCALTQQHFEEGNKGAWSGHGAFYLKGVCIDKDMGPAGLKLCPENSDFTNPNTGTGISISRNLKNINFLAFSGRSLFLYGGLTFQETLTAELRDQLIHKMLESQNPFEGVVEHDIPANLSPAEQQLYIARKHFGGDYALALTRNAYCVNVPMPRPLMGTIVESLNALNASYKSSEGKTYRGILRQGTKKDSEYHWHVLWDNCTHTPINALALAGVLEPVKTNLTFFKQLKYVAVPANTVLNIHKAINLEDIDVDAYYQNKTRRENFLKYQWIPQGEGAYTEFIPMHTPNELYYHDDQMIFLPNFLKDVSAKIRKWTIRPQSAYFGQKDLGFVPNLFYFQNKYEEALSLIAKKEADPDFKKISDHKYLEFFYAFKNFLIEKRLKTKERIAQILSEDHEH